MELNINSPVYYKDHYGINNAVYRFTQRAYLFFTEKEYSNTLQIIGIVPIIAPQEVYAAENYIENLFTTFLLNYLEQGKYTHILKECRGIGIGFVDGDLSILYKKDKCKVAEETIEFLLEEYKDREGFLSMLDEYGRDIFTHIISNEAEETALKALYAIDDVNREDQYGYSYLTFAGVGHKVKVIEELLRM